MRQDDGFDDEGWSLFDAVEDGGTLFLWLDPGAPAFTWAPLTLERSVDGGPWTTLDAATPGLYAIDRLSPGPHAVQVRARGAAGAGASSSAKTATPTAAGIGRFLSFTDEEPRHRRNGIDLGESLRRFGPTTTELDASNLNLPVRLELGGTMVVYDESAVFSIDSSANHPRHFDAGPVGDVPVARHRLYWPPDLPDLRPGRTAVETFHITRADGRDEVGEIMLVGACGVATWPAISAVAWDGDGHPVPIRFDRIAETGRHPDGRPFVVAPRGRIGFLRNGGPPIPVTVDAANPARVVAVDGAPISVVLRSGLWPSRENAVPLDVSWEYGPHAAELPRWSGGRPGDPARLTVFAQIETLHVYLDSDFSTPGAVRFREAGVGTWRRAQPLDFASQNATDHVILGRHPGRHRGVVRHLRPETDYEIEVRQGETIYATSARTRSYRPPVVDVATPAPVDGAITLDRPGSPERWLRYRIGRRSGLRVVIDAPYVVVERPWLRAVPGDVAIELTARAHNVHILDPIVTDWATDHRAALREPAPQGATTLRLTRPTPQIRAFPAEARDATYFYLRFRHRPAAELYKVSTVSERRGGDRVLAITPPLAADMPAGAVAIWNRWAREGFGAIYAASDVQPTDVLVLGGFVGTPRYPANNYRQFNNIARPNSRVLDGVVVKRSHPSGAQAVRIRGGGFSGLRICGLTAAPHFLHGYNDAIGASVHRNAGTVGFPGPNGVIDWCFLEGAEDNVIEAEGLNTAVEIAYNVLACKTNLPGSSGGSQTLALSPVQQGPIYAHHNVHHTAYNQGNFFPQSAYKIQRYSLGSTSGDGSEANENGRVYLWHETAGTGTVEEARAGRRFARSLAAPDFGWRSRDQIEEALGVHPVTGESFWPGDEVRYVVVVNALFRSRTSDRSGVGVSISASLLAEDDNGSWPLWPGVSPVDFRPLGPLPNEAMVLANVNDSGPFASPRPRIGAR